MTLTGGGCVISHAGGYGIPLGCAFRLITSSFIVYLVILQVTSSLCRRGKNGRVFIMER